MYKYGSLIFISLKIQLYVKCFTQYYNWVFKLYIVFSTQLDIPYYSIPSHFKFTWITFFTSVWQPGQYLWAFAHFEQLMRCPHGAYTADTTSVQPEVLQNTWYRRISFSSLSTSISIKRDITCSICLCSENILVLYYRYKESYLAVCPSYFFDFEIENKPRFPRILLIAILFPCIL